jgi:hypothetical protein
LTCFTNKFILVEISEDIFIVDLKRLSLNLRPHNMSKQIEEHIKKIINLTSSKLIEKISSQTAFA